MTDTNKHNSLLPTGFDWRSYVFRYPDLIQGGITTEAKAIDHYLKFGHKENRAYTKIPEIEQNTYYDTDQPFDLDNTYTFNISVLLFYPEDRSLRFLQHVPGLIMRQLLDMRCKHIDLHIRNNSLDFHDEPIRYIIDNIRKTFIDYGDRINIHYHTNHNIGFGRGHNANFYASASDFFLCLNDDISIPHAKWLKEAMHLFMSDDSMGIIGSLQSPQYLNSQIGAGSNRNIGLIDLPDYSEGSILFARSSVFNKLNGFDDIFRYFYFEDADLGLRAKQLGYQVVNINIPHQHFRSDSTKKIPNEIKSGFVESNRAKFLARWGKFLSSQNKTFTNKILLQLKADGVGDLADCFYLVKAFVNKHTNNHVFIQLPNDKLQFLYDTLDITYLEEELNKEDFDTIYTIADLNFAPPFHTLDLLAARLNLDTFDTSEIFVKLFIDHLPIDVKLPEQRYVIMHLDSQRQSFEGRMPDQSKLIPSIDLLLNKYGYKLVLIGQKFPVSDPNYNTKYENYIADLASRELLVDHRDTGSIQDMFLAINKADMFFGLDSGPSHIAQLLNVPSYVLYGPINPMSKIYRYENSGAWFNSDIDSGSGLYHLCIDPTYHYDIRRDSECINIAPYELADDLDNFITNDFRYNWIPCFEHLRYFQRNMLNLQMYNPMYTNYILGGNVASATDRTNTLIHALQIFEQYAMGVVRKNL